MSKHLASNTSFDESPAVLSAAKQRTFQAVNTALRLLAEYDFFVGSHP